MLAVQQIVLSASVAHILVATAIPILVGIVTKLSAPPSVKVPLTLLLTGIGTLIVQSATANGVAVLSTASLVTFAELFVAQLAVFFGLIKPTGARNLLAPQSGLG